MKGHIQIFVIREPVYLTRLIFQIHARTIPCGGVSCNCGVIAREGNHIVGVSVCRKGHGVVEYLRDPAVPGPVITGRGSYVTVDLEKKEFFEKQLFYLCAV